MTRPQGFASYQNFFAEIWQDGEGSWWAFLHLTPAGAMRTHHPAGGPLPVPGGPWTNRDDAVEAAKAACDAERASCVPSAAPRCMAMRPRRPASDGCTTARSRSGHDGSEGTR